MVYLPGTTDKKQKSCKILMMIIIFMFVVQTVHNAVSWCDVLEPISIHRLVGYKPVS